VVKKAAQIFHDVEFTSWSWLIRFEVGE